MTTLHYITETHALNELCQRMATCEFITVDTEFMRESTYYPQLCLIQVASPSEAACIDPLAENLDLSAFYTLLKNENVVKVFHAARQDLEIFYYRMECLPNPIFDTQVAAMVCGFGDSVGYDTLIAKTVGTIIDKSSRFTDWSLRPLSDKQIDYALADVTHLRNAYSKLKNQLIATGRETWVQEEMSLLTDIGLYRTDPADAWRRLKPRSTKPQFLIVLSELAAWREKEAQQRDVPRGRILRDESLEEIAAHPPTSLDQLARIRGVSKGWAEGKLGEALLGVVQHALTLPLSSAPAQSQKYNLHGTPSPALVELLKVLLRHVSDDAGVAPRLLATTSDLESIALMGDSAEILSLNGWRREIFGARALDLREGRLALAATKNKVKLIELETH